MATKKSASKKATKPVKKATKPAKKVVAKPAAKKVVKPVKKAEKPTKKVVAKPAAKKVVKPVKKATKPAKKVVAKPAAKKVVKPVKKAEKPTKKVVAKPIAKKVVKPVKKVEKPIKVKEPKTTKKIIKAGTLLKKPVAKPVKASGIEKSTTVIPMKQKPLKKKEEPVKDVKIPKTSIKSSVPYKPGYTPLESRTEKSKPGSPLVKYSDAELNEFKELINKKLESAQKELAYFQGVITRKDEGGDNEDGRYMTMEDGSLSMEREQVSQMASRTISYIDNLKKALMRIENKTYGVCRVTGKLIDKARLRVVPHATLSLEAKLGLVKPSSVE
ncbi:MAG: TraR/DksA family transcriptional regulator [Chitinophagaceae bacterium]|nr:TraR/DksA family transcriptional regulator [Chitinophagaceae bacterium]MCW5904277.1 TraR/DksA family transcriptional regulator [Chitinophagaceae bacterium]